MCYDSIKIELAGEKRLRVISGTAKGMALKSIAGQGTRPTTDKVKEAIFSMVGPYFNGGYGLDLFAGTGGLGIEALSRGLEKVIFIDMDYACIRSIETNLHWTGLSGQAEVFRNDAWRALKLLSKRGLSFDLVFLDPPYRLRLIEQIAVKMQEMNLIRKHATLVAEHDATVELADMMAGFSIKRRANYGATMISIYQFNQFERSSGGEAIEE